jgi:hypothetical protein
LFGLMTLSCGVSIEARSFVECRVPGFMWAGVVRAEVADRGGSHL